MSWALWITGRPGSGKTTIARQVAAALEKRGEQVVVLEAAECVTALIPDHAASSHELDIVHRALIYTAATLTLAGLPVIIDATAHRRAWRDLARATLHTFAEVQLVCGDATCGAREQAVRWRRMTSVVQGRSCLEPDVIVDYEYSLGAELTVDTEAQHVWTAVEDVLLLVERLRRARSDTSAAEGTPRESASS